MAITPEVIDRLKAQLLVSGYQQKNNPLFQVINQLIDAVRQSIADVQTLTGGGGGGGGGGIAGQSFATLDDDTATLPNSSRLIPIAGVEFNRVGGKTHILTALPFGLEGEPGEEGPMGPPGLQGLTGLPGSVSTILGVPIPIIDSESDEIIPVPLPVHGFESSGVWTPTIASSGGGTPTYSTQSGFWIKEKGIISGSFFLQLATLGTLAAGTLTIEGLPFTASPINGIPFLCIFAGMGVNQEYLYDVVNPSTTQLLLRKQTAAAASNANNLTLADITGTFIVAGGFLYFT